MRKNSLSVKIRGVIGALFTIVGLALAGLGLNGDFINRESRPRIEPQTSWVATLIGPARLNEIQQRFGTVKQALPKPSSISPELSVIPPAPLDPGQKVGFENFEAPGVLVNVTSSSQGPAANTVEYIGHDAGEPSIGVNWLSPNSATGLTAYQSDLQTDFVLFDDTCFPGGQKASWYNSQAPSSQFIDSDPIGFTDRQTGRTFCGQLTLTSPACKISFTDTDGKDALGQPGPDGWTPSTGPLASGIDHQTIGGGPYNNAAVPPPPPHPAYANAVYYCSQEGLSVGGMAPPAFCLRSDDGGANFNVGPITVSTTACGGLHGHVKVAPDGTVYLPFNNCGGQGAVDVSTDNGLTWAFHSVHTATVTTVASTRFQDPAVSVDTAGKLYFVMASGDSAAAVATSTDRGLTWQNLFDVGATFGLQNIAFPAAVAGGSGRAAVAFYGTTTPGDTQTPTFNGVWHLYVAHTFDGGQTWSTIDATPNSPVQRGCIWQQGGVSICRNLLDFFDMTVDKQGRVEVGWVTGCSGFDCAHSPNTATFHGNGYTATAVITRQSSGRRMFAANDPAAPTSVPGIPWLTQRRVGTVVHLGWSQADDGNSPITGYQILRGTVTNGETLLATVGATQTTYDDTTATDPTKTYFYKVRAVNALGASCANNEVAAPFIGDTCSGLIVQTTPPGHPEQPAQGAAPASLAIDYVAVAEPPGTTNFMFKMKVTSLATIPPNSRWRIVWNSFTSPGQQYFVGMMTGASGPPTFQFGEVMTGAIPPVIGLVGVPIETIKGTLPSNPQPNPDGTIMITVTKASVGNPPPGYLLGGVNGRTFTGDTPETVNLERSTLLIDHTFVKAQRDNGFPAATYTVVGNTGCIVPASAVSRKTHGGAGPFDVSLPLTGTPGVECRTGGATGGHQVVVTFPTSVAVTGASVTPGAGGTASVAGTTVAGNTVVVNLTNVSNAQTLTVNLLGVTDGPGSGTVNVAVPMSVLLGDTNATGVVNSTDVSQTKIQSGTAATNANFRQDVTINGLINSSDVSTVKLQSGTGLP
jgi:hypothetical protein